MIKALIIFGIGFVTGIVVLVGAIYIIGKAELKRLQKWE